MRLCDVTGESRILRKRNAAETRYECNIYTRNIGRLRLISIPVKGGGKSLNMKGVVHPGVGQVVLNCNVFKT